MGKTRAPQKRQGTPPRPGHPCHPRAGPSVPSGQGMRGSAWPLPGECPAWVRAPVTPGESSDSGRALLTSRRGPVRESVDAPGLGGVPEPQSPGPQELSLGQRWLPGAPPPPGATARTYQMKSVQWLQKQRTLLWWHWRDLPTMIFPVLVLFSTLLCHIAIAGRTCPKPDDLPFAVVVPLKTFYEPGEQIVYSCKPGYVSRGGMRRFTCPLTGMWPINTLKCTRRVCPFAGILENGIVRYTSFEYPNTINFTCNPGFYLNGTSSSKCNEEGKWSPELPVCVPMACPPPPVPKSATLKAHKSLAGNTSLYGDTEVFECLPQHAMFGNDTITCTAHGNWTKLPECKEVKCPFPSRPDNGFVNYPAKQVLYYKDKATFGCHDTYTLDGPEEVECTKMGNWSALPSCKASCKISIKKATVLYQGMRVKIQDQFKDGMKHGDKVSFFCKNKEKKCSYTEEANCIDGTLEIPKCFKEHSSLAFWKTDAWDVKPC